MTRAETRLSTEAVQAHFNEMRAIANASCSGCDSTAAMCELSSAVGYIKCCPDCNHSTPQYVLISRKKSVN